MKTFCFKKSVVNILSWNIGGLATKLKPTNSSISNSKLNVKSIQKILNEYDIVGIQETWLKDNSISFPGYSVYTSNTKTNSQRGCRGVAALIRNEIKGHVEIISSGSPNIIWLKLQKLFFGLDSDIFIAVTYLPPLQSQKKSGDDVLNTLNLEIQKFHPLGKIIIIGDLNARTGLLDDKIRYDSISPTMDDPNYIVDEKLIKRNNSDISVNKQGKEILNLCIENKFYILNGRTLGDFEGNFTSYQPLGTSTIDYAIISESLAKNIINFKVDKLTPYSDHCPISLKLAVKYNIVKQNKTKDKISENHKYEKFVWDIESGTNFRNMVQSDSIQSLLNKFIDKTHENIDDEIETFNDILINNVAKCCLKIKSTRQNKSNKRNKKHKPWFNAECKYLKNVLKKIAKEINTTNFNSKRHEYYNIKKKYKKAIKKAHRHFKNTIIKEMESLDISDRNNFWNSLNKLKAKENMKDESIGISGEEWINHFKTLLHTDTNEPCTSLPINHQRDTTCLDKPITELEIQNQISKLKNKKATGIDYISNEMIKNGRISLIKPMVKIFNNVLNSSTFPKIWNSGLIKTIYKKKGDPSLPTNYRGITLNSCLSKLFTSVLQNRLVKFLEENNILNDEQFGFRSNLRTTDNLFIFKQILHKYFSNKQKLYVSFIDYEKAFDSVWHNGLFNKMQNLGINGKFFNIIRSMYSTINSSVLINGKISESFSSNRGIKQGDGLSPVLFSLFMNDIPEKLRKEGCLGVKLKNQLLNCLMFADDLILISQTAEGLQNSLNVLNKHANEWKLKINTSKTKVMIFNKQGRKSQTQDHSFHLDKEPLEFVQQHTYLGLVMSSSGRFTFAREILSQKALKVLSMIRRMLSNCVQATTKTYCKLFDALVKPVLLYGSEIWGPELLNYKTPFDKSVIEQVHLRFCKQILHIPWYTSNQLSRAEIGRVPLDIDIKSSIYSYFLRLKHNITNKILKDAFLYSVSYLTDFNVCCKSYIDINAPLNNSNTIQKQELKGMRKKMKNKLQEEYVKTWKDNLDPHNDTYIENVRNKKIKTSFEKENYLDIIKQDRHRIELTKLRLGVHKLRIQTGKYEDKGKPIIINSRTCLICKTNMVEDIFHFLIQCNKYQDERLKYFNKISSLDGSFNSLTDMNKAIYIIQAKNNNVAKIIGQLVTSLSKTRYTINNQ